MGFAIVHMQKFNSNSLGGIRSHVEREHKPRTNPDVDDTKSNLNYNIDNLSAKNLVSKINSRLKDIQSKRKIRADAVKLAGFIVTSDNKTMKELSSDQQQEYFKDSVKFFQDRYGTKNIIYAKVHMDEKTPHLHVGVVPVVNKNEKLSAKTLFTKTELTNLQSDFAKDVGFKYGLKRGTEDSKNKHVNIPQLKIQTANEQAKKIINIANNKAIAISKDIADCSTNLDEIKKIENNSHYKSKIFGEDKSEIVMLTSNYNNLLKTAYSAIKSSAYINTLKNDKKSLEHQLWQFKDSYERVTRLNNNLNRELTELNFIRNMPTYLKKDFIKTLQDVQNRDNYMRDTLNKKCVVEFIKANGDISKAAKVMHPLIKKCGGSLITGQGINIRQHIKICVSVAKGQIAKGKVPVSTPPVTGHGSWRHSPAMTNYRKNPVNEYGTVSLKLPDIVNNILQDTDWTMLTDFEKMDIQFQSIKRV